MLRLTAVCVLLLAGLPPTAAAAGLGDCRAIRQGDERLACYDRLATAAEDAPAAAAAPPAAGAERRSTGGGDSLLGQAWELDPDQRGRILRVRPYQPVYLLPVFRASSPNRRPSSPSPGHTAGTPLDLSRNEAKFQISLKTKAIEDLFGSNGDLWFGYTQSSRWQVFNDGLSRPFRETDHEPEALFVWRTDYALLGWRGRLVDLSLNHQSNGRSLPLSRSWNRVLAGVSLERDDWTLTLRPWWRLPESAAKDDNPDIANYLGRGDLHLVRRSGSHQFSLVLRHSLRGGGNSHGGLQLDYAFPIAGDLRGHLQWFSGYGESLIDYNHRANYLGLGVSLLEWY